MRSAPIPTRCSRSWFDLGFWECLPLAGALAASFGILLGFPVLRLRGDYLAIVTLGFGEIIRIILLNWYDGDRRPGRAVRHPAPDLLRPGVRPHAAEGETAFHEFFGLEFSGYHRVAFLYFLILILALVTNAFVLRIRKLPIGRAWEALREDEIACRALGINPTNTKLTAFALGAMFGGFARLVLRHPPGLHQPGELHLHRIARRSSRSSCSAAWAARSAWCSPRWC